MTKQKRSIAALRRLIRQIVREELSRLEESETHRDETWAEPDEQNPPSPPPWAVFGSPRPAPERPSSPSHRSFGPYQPQEQELNPPPYIPHQRD